MVTSKMRSKKIEKINKSIKESINYPKECKHNWHLVNSTENYFYELLFATFICSECGDVKKIEVETNY